MAGTQHRGAIGSTSTIVWGGRSRWRSKYKFRSWMRPNSPKVFLKHNPLYKTPRELWADRPFLRGNPTVSVHIEALLLYWWGQRKNPHLVTRSWVKPPKLGKATVAPRSDLLNFSRLRKERKNCATVARSPTPKDDGINGPAPANHRDVSRPRNSHAISAKSARGAL